MEKPDRALYIFDRKTLPLPIPLVIGDITVEVTADDDVAISNVSFYIDDQLKYTDYTPPYTWLWDEKVFGFHTIKVVATDTSGNTASAEQRVFIINLI